MSIHSKDGTTGLTKLERIGVRAKRNINSVFNNLGHAVDKTLLREQYQKLDGRKAIGTYKPKPSRLVEIPNKEYSANPAAEILESLALLNNKPTWKEYYQTFLTEMVYDSSTAIEYEKAIATIENISAKVIDPLD